jgi:hypothetical protein
MEQCVHALYKSAVEGLGNSVVLWSVVRRKPPLGALLLEECSELCPGVLSTLVGAQAFDARAVLSVHPSGKGLVGVERLIFGAKN